MALAEARGISSSSGRSAPIRRVVCNSSLAPVQSHAVILQEQGSLARVAVWPPGRSTLPGVRPVTMWIDLASAEQCDAGAESLTTIGVGDAPKHGALFLVSGELSKDSMP